MKPVGKGSLGYEEYLDAPGSSAVASFSRYNDSCKDARMHTSSMCYYATQRCADDRIGPTSKRCISVTTAPIMLKFSGNLDYETVVR